MLKHENPEAKGLDELQRLAGSGRTSIPIDKETPKSLYRTIGYRVCGERAIRVDILERLADLIRPALAWREGAPGPRPPGAFNGFGFTVTGAMTSLTGASARTSPRSCARSAIAWRSGRSRRSPRCGRRSRAVRGSRGAAADRRPDAPAAERCTGWPTPTARMPDAEAPAEPAPALAPDARRDG